MNVVGVDACRAGWVAVTLGGGVQVHATFDSVIAGAAPDAVIGVDMPIGLVERGARTADLEVRRFLAHRRASLFIIPARSVVTARSYRDACRRSERATGKRISLQTWHLFPKLREVDRHAADPRLLEVHPETSFALMAGAPLGERKHTPAGRALRRSLLAAQGIEIDGDHDTLDAAAAAWSARRWLAGTARRFPAEPRDIDRSGRAICIVA